MIRIAALAALFLGAPVALAEDGPAILKDHQRCALQGRSSAVCAEVLTGHCLDTAQNIRQLTRCRAGLARALDRKAQDLAAQFATSTPHRRTRATEILAGSDRVVADYCASFGGRMATEGSAGHNIRCALMAGHVKVYHLLRLAHGSEGDI